MQKKKKASDDKKKLFCCGNNFFLSLVAECRDLVVGSEDGLEASSSQFPEDQEDEAHMRKRESFYPETTKHFSKFGAFLELER